MAVRKRKTADMWKKKEWYTIYSPDMFEKKEIGSSPTDDESKLMNRVIKVPLRDITHKINHQFIKMMFRVTEIKGREAYTEFDGFELVREYLRRNVRRRRSMIRVIVTGVTKDGKKVRVTAYAFTSRKIDSSKKSKIREIMTQIVSHSIKTDNLRAIVQKFVFGNVSADIFRTIKVISPIKRIEIGKCIVLREEK